MPRRLAIIGFLIATLLALPDRADAQWQGALFFGANHTQASDVSIAQPTLDTDVTFHDVEFSAKPFASPQYYGLRVGRMFGRGRRFGVEAEFVHLKVISETGTTYTRTGRVNGIPVDDRVAMNTFAERYAMTHGLNFLLFNVVVRQPLSASGMAFVLRAGAGPTRPHTETTVGVEAVDRYEWGGIGVHAAAGVEVPLTRWMAAMAEYKLTTARPEISVAHGTGVTRATSHHLAFGLAFGRMR